MDQKEKQEFVDMVAQAVIDRIEERERVNQLADMVVKRVLDLQAQEAAIKEKESHGKRA